MLFQGRICSAVHNTQEESSKHEQTSWVLLAAEIVRCLLALLFVFIQVNTKMSMGPKYSHRKSFFWMPSQARVILCFYFCLSVSLLPFQWKLTLRYSGAKLFRQLDVLSNATLSSAVSPCLKQMCHFVSRMRNVPFHLPRMGLSVKI